MPDWLVSVLIQFPIVVVIGFVAWYAYKQVERVTDARISREEQYHAAAVAELKASHEQAAALVRADVTKLGEDIRRMGRKLDELNRRLSG